MGGEEKDTSALQEMLETDGRWVGAYHEYLRVKKAVGRRRPEWYELFNGPSGPGVRNLAVHLQYGTYYEIIYRLWSRRMHGTDVVQRVKAGSAPGSLLIEPRRYAADVNVVLDYALSFGLASIRSLVGYYVPKEKRALAEWYIANICSRWPTALQRPTATL